MNGRDAPGFNGLAEMSEGSRHRVLADESVDMDARRRGARRRLKLGGRVATLGRPFQLRTVARASRSAISG